MSAFYASTAITSIEVFNPKLKQLNYMKGLGIMFISKLLPINKGYIQTFVHTKTEITVKPYVDPFWDTVGWYALGHHDRQQFLNAVIKQEKYPYAQIDPSEVQLIWAKFNGKSFELAYRDSEDVQPITLVETCSLP